MDKNLRDILSLPAPDCARRLVGWELVMASPLGECGGIIVETEAYTADDPASHSYRRRTTRNAPMFAAAGTLYVYLIYGRHYCLNLVCGQSDGQAVLIRALQPTRGLDLIARRRPNVKPTAWCNGPGSVTRALGIDLSLNGVRLAGSPLSFLPPFKHIEVQATPRVGITRGRDTAWRFVAID